MKNEIAFIADVHFVVCVGKKKLHFCLRVLCGIHFEKEIAFWPTCALLYTS